MSDLTTNQKSIIAETAVTSAAVRAGVSVLLPLADERYDLVFDLGPRFVRVQCKWAGRNGEVLIVRCRSCRRSRDGLVHRAYKATEIDAFAAYCPELDRCFYLPFEAFGNRSAVQLRLGPARNNQSLGVNWADDYDFERLHWDSL